MARAASEEQFEKLRAAVEQIAAEDVAELVSEARAQARELVRPLLVQALADAMIDAVRNGLPRARRVERAHGASDVASPPPSSAQPGPPTPPPVRMPEPAVEHGLYAYCVVAADATLPTGLAGIDGRSAPMLVRDGELAAVVSQVPLSDFEEKRLREHLSDMQWVEQTARAHEHVLETLTERTTLVPMRMCTVYRSESGVRDMLKREARALQDALEHLEGKAEWGVKLFVEDRRNRRTRRTDEADETAASGTDYMRLRQSEREERWRIDDELNEACAAIHEYLSGITADSLTAPLQRPEVSGHSGQMLLNGVYLVEVEHQEEFLALVEKLRNDYEVLGLQLEPTGPWPAYNFVPGTIGAAW